MCRVGVLLGSSKQQASQASVIGFASFKLFLAALREYARENEPNKTQMLRWGRPIFAKIAPGVGLGLKTHQATIFSKIFGGKFEFWSVFGRFFPIFLKLREAIWGAKNEFRRGFNTFL